MRQDDRGVVTVFVVGITVALLVMSGLVVDGGYALAARREAANVAEAAARAGAQVLDESQLRGGTGAPLDRSGAIRAAQDYLDDGGYVGTVVTAGNVVVVEVTLEQPVYLLGLAGVGPMTITGTGRARPVRGITAEGI